jgi:putative flippase GtrA
VAASFPRFIAIGALGFCVDAGLLTLFIAADTGLYSARLVSFPMAVTVTWYLNRIWTFREGATDRPTREYVSYVAVQVVAALASFLLYAALLRWVLGERAQMAVPALAIGAVVGLVINYLGARVLVFVGGKPPTPCAAQDRGNS